MWINNSKINLNQTYWRCKGCHRSKTTSLRTTHHHSADVWYVSVLVWLGLTFPMSVLSILNLPSVYSVRIYFCLIYMSYMSYYIFIIVCSGEIRYHINYFSSCRVFWVWLTWHKLLSVSFWAMIIFLPTQIDTNKICDCL